eukprot:Em0017g953a
MTGLLALFAFFQASMWIQAEAITPTYPPSLPPLYVYNVPESYGNNVSTYENVSINAASPINAIDPGGFLVTYSIPAYSVNSDKFCMKDNASGLIYVCHGVILDREVLTPDPLRASLLLTVTASNGAFTSTTTVYVYLTDVNDNPPQMTNLPASISLSETTEVGTKVFTVTATDKDQSFFPIYNIINSSPFSVAPSTGIITLSGSLDYNTQPSHSLIITLKDQLNDSIALTSTSTLIVMVIPVSRRHPVFTQPSYSASVFENSTIGTAVVQMSAYDGDRGINDTIIYSIINGNNPLTIANITSPSFGIGNLSGVIYVLVSRLKWEVYSTYILQVQGTKKNSPLLTAITMVTISVIDDMSDNTPMFVQPFYSASVDETSPLGRQVLSVSAVDPAVLNNIRFLFAIVNTSVPFSIDQLGVLRVNGSIDYAVAMQYSFQIIAVEYEVPIDIRKTATALVTISVQQLNRYAPVFDNATYYVSLYEARLYPTALTVRATDVDLGTFGVVSYLIVQPDSEPFVINSTSGDISMTAALSYAVKNRYTLVIQATDGASYLPKTGQCTVVISVLAIITLPPMFNNPALNVSITETTPPGTFLYTFQYSDPNPVVPPAVPVLTILSGYELFRLNGSSLYTNASFNYDVINNYTLVLLLNNSVYTSNVTFQVLLIHVNKFSPVFILGTYYFEVSESAAIGTSVGNIRAADADTGLFGVVVYSLAGAGNTSFTVNTSTGALVTSTLLNRLTTPSYAFLGVASDSDPNPSTKRSATVSITIKVTNDNNHPPMFSVLQVAYNVLENTPILLDQSGLPLVVRATTLNMGAYATIAYQIISGNTNSLFVLDNFTGYLSRNPYMVIDREQAQQYNLTILAWITALPSLNSSVMVTINIVDTNDHTPEFSSSNYSIILSEATPPGLMYQFTAIDLDSGTNAQLNFSIVTSISTFKASIFSITSNGAMSLTAALDREAFAGPYGITVMVTDGGVPPLNSTTVLLVYITDVNDNAPLFPLDVYTIQLNPSVSPTYITTVTAFDNDQAGTPNSNVTYSIASVTGSMGSFSINEVTGTITSTSPLHSQDSYIISVVASDQGTPPMSSNTTVAITVTAVYDATPNFSLPGYVFNVNEDTSVNTRLEGISAAAGVGVSIVYSTDFSGPFVIDPATAELVLVSELSYGEDMVYELTVVAHNADYPSKRSSCNVTIQVLQVNRHSPVFNSSNYITSVLEGSPSNTPVVKVTATDLDVGVYGVVTYSITGGNMGGVFAINQSTGQLSTLVLINRSVLVYTLNLMAVDGGSPPRSSVTVATVTVMTTNDYAPVFTSAVYTGSVPEATTAGFTVVIVAATDADFGSNDAVVRYSINDTTNFVIDPIYGVLTTNAVLFYAVQSHYTISVTAYDLGTPPMSNSTVITVQILPLNLHPPVFASIPSPITIGEDVPVNYSVITLVATDADSGSNALLSFDLANDLGYFSINSNGTIFVNAPMDEEAVSSFNLTVIASDCGSPQRSSAVTYVPISVLDIHPLPTFTQAVYMVSVIYPNDANITLKATDLDAGINANISFVIAEGNSNVFGLRVASGPIVTLYNKQPLSQPAYSLRIDAFNIYQNQTRSSAIISIVVLGIRNTASLVPSFGVTSFTQTISEASPIGTFLYPVLHAVANTSSSITYSLSGCVSSFGVDATTGIIELIDILDREVASLYNCTLVASNGFGSTSIPLSILVLDSNDNTPIFSSTLYRVNVKESTLAGKSIGRVVAQDGDQASNAIITYTILSGDDVMAPKFSIISSTGVLLTTNTPLDRNLKASYILTVQATDSVNEATAVVYVTVEDQNDHAPMFVGAPYVSNISETTLIVATLQATDADAGLNAVIKFSINLGNTTIFQIDENSGLVTARPNMLSYGNQATYTLLVLAVDQAVNMCERRTAATTVTINLLPSNDHRPVFSQDTYSISIVESISVGQVVLNVTATDADPGISGQFTYRINQNLSSSSFSITSLSGSIKSTAVLDREVQSTHLLILEAVDKGTPPLTGTAALYITLQDVNDNSPYFSINYYFVSIAEATPIDTGVILVQASDADLNTVLTYSISGDSYPLGFFKINAYTGLIQTARRLDNEASSLVTLTVQASDGLNSGITLVQISVTDGNDKPPQFLQSSYNCTIPENSPAGTRVSVLLYDGSRSRIVAMDPDIPSTPVVYQLSGNAINYFNINQTSGVMSVKQGAVLDRESRRGYWIYGMVVAIDANGLGLSSTAQLSVQISDVIEHPPVFSGSLGYSLALWENTPLQTVSNQVKATSVDIQSIGYSIIGASPWPFTSSLLAIDALSGLVNLTGTVDREVFPFSNQSLQARGNVIPALFATTSLQVSVLDTNDKAPVFNSTVYTVVVMENISVGGAVLQVWAVDPDLGYGGVVVYSMVASDGPFFINPTTGLLSTTDRLSYKIKRLYTISVQACDQGSPVMCSSTLASVQVLSGNDHTPIFTYPAYQLSIPSDLTQNSSIIRPVAMDADTGAAAVKLEAPSLSVCWQWMVVPVPLTGTSTLTISIFNVNTSPPRFTDVFYETSVPENMAMAKPVHVVLYTLANNKLQATIATKVTLDREQVDQYNLIITDNENTTVGLAAQSVTIRVLDVNDNYPTFLQPLYSFSLLERIGPSGVGVVAAFDLDAGNNGTVVYSLQSTSNPSGTFIINGTTGQLNTTGPLNREQVPFYNLTVIGMDLGTPFRLSTQVTVLVSVLDVNDNPPIFSQASYTTSIFDNSPIGSSVAMVAASDMDVGTNAQIWYSILSGSNGQFIIDSTTGLIMTNTTLRYISNSAYTLIVMATDCGTPALSSNVTVIVYLNDSNDCTPAFLSNVTLLIRIMEGPPAVRSIASLSPYVVDCDPGPAGITYSILAGNTLSWFSINPTSGVITTTIPLDRENISSFLLTVQVKDGFPPALALASQLEISVVVHAHWTDILTVATTDKDASSNAAVNYSLAGQSPFISVTPTGSVFVNKTLSRGRFNVTVVATDRGTPRMNSTAVVSMTVLGVNSNSPVFTNVVVSPRTSVSINENASIGDVVFVVMATDRDSGSNGQIAFSFGFGNEDGKFSIHSLSGVISVASRLNYRLTQFYQLTVIAQDMGTPPRSSSATLTVQILTAINYFPPLFRFSSYTATLLDATPSNTSVVSMAATDADVPGTLAANITYLLVGPNSGYFRIDNSGNVFTNGVLNQQQISSFLLEGVAINSYASPVLFSSVNLMVTVATTINNRPVFVQSSYAISIPELTSPGTTVLSVLATDIDQPGTPNSLVSYSFSVGSPSNVFTLLPSGDVVLYGTLDWSTTVFYKLTVCASDAGAPAVFTCVPLNVTILDQNTYPPVFKYQAYTVSVYENVSTFPWPLSVNLSYSDRDSTYNALSAYFIATVNGQKNDSTFSLNQSTGALVLNEMVKVLKIRTYEIEIMVVNIRMGRGSLCTSTPCRFQDTITITVNVLDVNDHSPVFNSSIYYLYVSNDTAVGTAVTTLSATDLDDGVLGQNGITYLFYGTIARVNPFRIETRAGGVAIIYTSSLLGSYDGTTFNLPVVAKDGGIPPNTNSTNVTILVLSNTKRLLVTFECDLSTLYAYQAAIVDTLNKAVPGYNVTVETIKPYVDPSTGQPVSNITELVFHVYDVQNKTFVDYLLYYDLAGMVDSGNASTTFDVILTGAIPSNCSVQSLQPISQIVVPPTTSEPITYTPFTPYTPGKNYTEINVVTVTVTVATLPVIVVLPARVDIQILIVMVFCGVLALGALILTLLSFYQRYAALHDARTKLLADVFYGNQGTNMVENLQLQNLQLDELNSNTQIQRENPIFVHPYEDWIGTNDPTKASIGEESSGTRQLDNPLYEEQELRMDMFSQDSDEDGEVDEAELLAAALQDDDDNEDNTITAI